MNSWVDQGVILSIRPHGENGGIISLLTQNHGRYSGYVYGAKSSKMRGILEIGNVVRAEWQSKDFEGLGKYDIELDSNNIVNIMDNPKKLLTLQSLCTLVDKTLPEREEHVNIYNSVIAMLDSFNNDMWEAVYVYWEIGLLKELGFGLDLDKCAVTGTTEKLSHISPKTGRAVCEIEAEPYKDKLLELPKFLNPNIENLEEIDIFAGLRLTGYFLQSRIFDNYNKLLPDVRLRLLNKYS